MSHTRSHITAIVQNHEVKNLFWILLHPGHNFCPSGFAFKRWRRANDPPAGMQPGIHQQLFKLIGRGAQTPGRGHHNIELNPIGNRIKNINPARVKQLTPRQVITGIEDIIEIEK